MEIFAHYRKAVNRRCLISLVLLFFGSGNALAKSVACTYDSEPTRQAARFLSGLRQDLVNTSSVLSFSGEVPLGVDTPLIGFTVDIYDGPLHASANAHKVASLSFQFNKNCVLEKYSANDLTIPSSRNDDTISGTVNSHPEWSDEQIVAFLKEKGAKYGPSERQAFMKSLNLVSVELLLGKLEVKDVRFKVGSEDHVGDFAELEWVVEALATNRGYPTNHYKLLFDPFDGRLVSILRIPGPYEAEKPSAKR